MQQLRHRGPGLFRRRRSSLLAGAILLLARPFEPGDLLLVHVPELGGTIEARLLRIGLRTSTLCTESGVLVLANRELLAIH